jgi:hypothetical protein
MANAETWRPAFAGDGHIRFYSLARHALVQALILAGVRRGSRVLLPQYLCRDLLAPLYILGASPCWYSLASNLTPDQPSIDWPVAEAVLAVNYFGFPQDLAPFRTYAQRTGARVIEDNAHGYLSRDQDKQWLGCRTGLGVFSLRKTLRIPDGGVLWVGATFDVREVPAQVAFDAVGINPAQMIKARLRALPAVGEFAYRSSTSLVRGLRKWRTGSDIPAPDSDSEQKLPVPENPWAGLLPALDACAEHAEIERRRLAYARFSEVGRQVGAQPVFSRLPSYCSPYAYAFRGNLVALAGMRRHAAREGFDLVRWPDLPTEIVGHAPAYYHDVFLVNFLW